MNQHGRYDDLIPSLMAARWCIEKPLVLFNEKALCGVHAWPRRLDAQTPPKGESTI